MRIRIKDVASRANVTSIVVSKVLHDCAETVGVSDATAERVRNAAAELGYRPNVTARQFRNQRTSTIGILNGIGCPRPLLNTPSRHFATLFDGILAGAFKHGYSVTICPKLFAENPLEAMSEGGFDGFVWYSASPTTCYKALASFTGPIVLIHTQSGEGNDKVPSVRCDNDQGLGLAIDHLARLGHRKIAFSYSREARFGEVSLPLESIQRHMTRHFLKLGREDYIDVGVDGAGVRDYFAKGLRHTAVICVSDSAASYYLHQSREAGVRVPDDLATVGFDSRNLCEQLRPRLTSVAQPIEVMGRRAVDLLVRRISHEVDVPSLLIPCSLDVRDSTLSISHKEIIS